MSSPRPAQLLLLLLLHSSCCWAAAWLWQSTHLFQRGCCCCCLCLLCCYCCKLFMHFEVYLKHARQGISFHGISNVVLFSHLLLLLLLLLVLRFVAVCWFYVLFFLLHLPQIGGAQSGCPCPAATYGHLNLPPSLHLHLPLSPTLSANNLCVFPWVWFIFSSAFQQLKQSACFTGRKQPRKGCCFLQCSMLDVDSSCFILVPSLPPSLRVV